MRAPGTVQGPRPLSKSDEGGPRKGKRGSTPFKGAKMKKLKAKLDTSNKNQRLRSPGPAGRKAVPPSGCEVSSLKEESFSKSSTPPKASPKKRSASTGSSKAMTDVGNESPKGKSSPKKEERGRSPKKSPSKPVKSKRSSSDKSPSGESSSLKSKKSLEEGFTPKPKRCEKSQSRESCSPKRGRKSSVGEGRPKEGEKDPSEAKRQRIARSIEAVINRYTRESPSASLPFLTPAAATSEALESQGVSPSHSKPTADEEREEKGDKEHTLKRCRGRPKGSKNKIKKEGAKMKEKARLEKFKAKMEKGKKKLALAKKALDSKVDGAVPAVSTDSAKESTDVKGKKKLQKLSLLQKALKKKPKLAKKVLSSKAIKSKDVKSKASKGLSLQHKGSKAFPSQGKGLPHKESESSESETDSKKAVKSKHKTPPKSKVKEEDADDAETDGKKLSTKVKSPAGVSYRSKGGKSVSVTPSEKVDVLSSDFSDMEEKAAIKPLKKALKDKWSRELKKSVKFEGHDLKKAKSLSSLGRRRDHPHVCYEEESDRESEIEDLYPKVKKEARAPGRKRKRKKSVKSETEEGGEEEEEEEKKKSSSSSVTPTLVIPKRTARMASLNAIAMMACMNEDAKVPLPSFPHHDTPVGASPSSSSSMALVVRESTIARRHSEDETEDSDDEDDDSDRGYSPPRRPGKRKPVEDAKTKAKRRRRRRGELDVTMDMKDMVVTKRMASLNASAIMAASFSTEARSKRTTSHLASAASPARESEVTKISFKATKKQNLKTRSVITVQETTKKVKKAQGEGSTEVEEHIIVKKKVKRQSGMHVEAPDTDREATDTDNEILPKSPDDSGVIMESTTITYVTTQTHTVPQTVTLSGVKEYSVSTSNGKTTTMMQQVQRKSVTTTCNTGPPTSTSAVPTALIPPTKHPQVAQKETRNQVPRAPPNYSPLGALEVMQPVMHHPPPPPPPPSSHFITYPHPHHGPPIPHPHHMHPHHPPPPPTHPPPPLTINSHHHHMPPHHPSSPYPPLSPHSPPYPPPPPSSSSSSSSSSPACPSSTSPSSTPHPHPSPSSCHSSTGYRSPAPCSPGFPPPVSSPKQCPPPGGAPYREERGHPPPMSSPNGLVERHHSAFSAPTPSTHSPASGAGHSYQPVSGPIPTGGSPNAGGYKPPQGSPGGSSGPQQQQQQVPPPYSSPSRLTSPPPAAPHPSTNKAHYPSNDHYPGAPHPYQSYPYPGSSPYDKYYSRTPSYPPLYQPSYAAGGQYPPGEYGYQPPPSGTVHYSQESYTSYTLCVPAPPPTHGPPQGSGAPLALPPPPPTSNAPLHHHSPSSSSSSSSAATASSSSSSSPSPYTTYHCTEYTPAVFPYPPPGTVVRINFIGPTPQNAVCCPAGGSKNVSSGPLTGSGKGPEALDCGGPRKSLPGPSGGPSSNYQYYGGASAPSHPPPPRNQNSHMAVGGPSHGGQHQGSPPSHGHGGQHQGPPPSHSMPESLSSNRQQQQHHQPPHPHHHSYTSQQQHQQQQQEMTKNLRHPSYTESSPSINRNNVPKSPKDKPPSAGNPPGFTPNAGPPASVALHKTPVGECKDGRSKDSEGRIPPKLIGTSATSLTVAPSRAPSGMTTAAVVTTSSIPTSFAMRAPYVKSSCSSSAPLSAASSSSMISRPLAVSTSSAFTSSTSAMNAPLLAIAASLPGNISVSAIPAPVDKGKSKHFPSSDSPATPLSLSRGRQDRAEECGAKNHLKSTAKVDTSSASNANGTLIPMFPTGSAPLKTTTWVVQPSASSPSPHPPQSGGGGAGGVTPTPSRALLLSPTNTTISVSLSNTNSSTNSVMSTTAPVVASLENVLVTNATAPSDMSSFCVRSAPEKLKDKPPFKDATALKDNGNKSSGLSQRPGGRHHLLCQPLPLSHTKVTSVLAKAKPSLNALSAKPASDDSTKNYHLPSGFKPDVNDSLGVPLLSAGTGKLPKNDKCVALPRKRGRPPKVREGVLGDGTSSNGTEGKHFCRAPGEVSAREDNVPRKRMSLLKSSGAKSVLALELPLTSQKKTKLPSFFSGHGHDLQGVKKDVKLIEEIKINVKTETLGKIKSERVSPKFRDPKLKLLNGDSDIFDAFPEKVLKGTYFQPPLGIGGLETQESLKKKLKSENDCEDTKTEERKTPKLGRPPKFFFSRLKGPRMKVGFKPKQRRKASLLAYLKEKNNESDASLGETDPLPPPPLSSLLPDEDDDLKKQKEDEGNKMFPSYTALSIRGRRSSGAGKGKCLRKPKYYHGWSWDGEPHEGKVWLRNDEMLIIRKCYTAMKHKEGDTIRVRDCVLLRSGPRKTDLPFVAKVAALWEDPETCDMMMSILWYYRPEHTESGRRDEDLADEIFASKHRDHLSVACIEDRCYVLTFNEYCRYRRLLRLFQEKVCVPNSPVPDSEEGYQRKGRQPPGCVVQDILFFCRKVYDYRQKRILKNPC